MKLSILSILVTAVAAAALPAAKPDKQTPTPTLHAGYIRDANRVCNDRKADQCGDGVCWEGHCYYENRPTCFPAGTCSIGECRHGYCYVTPYPTNPPPALPPATKRDTQDAAKDPTCHNDVDCEGGSCLNGICIVDPPTKRDTETNNEKRDTQNISKDPTCHNDVDCEGGSCLSGICIADPPAKQDAEA